MDLKYFLENNKINSFINSKYKKYKIAYHITTFKNAQNILKMDLMFQNQNLLHLEKE